MRNLLGLDRLAIGGGGGVNNGGSSVEAGKYVMKGVYVGAKQATSGSGTQAQVQIDLTKRLKFNTTVGTGGQVTGFTTPRTTPVPASASRTDIVTSTRHRRTCGGFDERR